MGSVINVPGFAARKKGKPIRRAHRFVILPDYQGMGIGTAFAEMVGDVVNKNGCVYWFTTAHPGLKAYFQKHAERWKLIGRGSLRSCGMRYGKKDVRGLYPRAGETYEYITKK